MTDKIEKLADHLRGTCKSLDEGCEELFDHDSTGLTLDECQELDNLVFECSECSWWCESSEESSHTVGSCTDCEPDEEDE